MHTTVLRFEKNGKCDLCQKDGEVAVVQTGQGEPQRVLVSRLLEVLRWNSSIRESTNAKNDTDSAKPRSRTTSH